jgi:fermentation-respiration switch protein FrsA (DUF1100 family)
MKFFIWFLAVAAAAFIIVRALEKRTAFYPLGDITETPKDIGLDCEDLEFFNEDGLKLNAWLIKADRARHNLLFFHGNAGNISHRLYKIRMFNDLGFNVLIVDYRGYGRSAGAPSEQGIYEDARSAFDYLVARADIGELPVIAYGESLGGAVAVDLALRRKLAGLICDSTFTSAQDMAAIYFPWVPSFMLSLKFDSLHKIPSVRIPKLFVHSPQDEIVPYALARKLFAAAAEPKAFLELKGGHNDNVFMSEDVFRQGLEDFMKREF